MNVHFSTAHIQEKESKTGERFCHLVFPSKTEQIWAVQGHLSGKATRNLGYLLKLRSTSKFANAAGERNCLNGFLRKLTRSSLLPVQFPSFDEHCYRADYSFPLNPIDHILSDLLPLKVTTHNMQPRSHDLTLRRVDENVYYTNVLQAFLIIASIYIF